MEKSFVVGTTISAGAGVGVGTGTGVGVVVGVGVAQYPVGPLYIEKLTIYPEPPSTTYTVSCRAPLYRKTHHLPRTTFNHLHSGP